jgi:hypothetical protein
LDFGRFFEPFRRPGAGAGGFGRAGGCADSCAESAEAEPDLAGAERLARVGPWVPGAAQVVDEVAGEAQLAYAAMARATHRSVAAGEFRCALARPR